MLKKLTAFFFCILFLLTPALALEGMDVSVFQGKIDFAAAREDGIQAVYIRSSYGQRGVDENFRQNYTGAKDAGLSYGFYHYLSATTPQGARQEAEHFAALLRSLSYDCRPVLDFEGHRQLSPRQATAVALAFLERVEQLLGQQPMIYADHSTAAVQLGASVAQYPLWLAQWGVPSPSLSGTPWRQWTGWQYTNVGLVNGVTGYVDRDQFTPEILLRQEEVCFFYTVRPGDTLWALSRRFGTTIEQLVKDNHISNPNLIYVNQILRIPGQAPIEETYTVQPGDTLWAISRQYGTTVEQLVQLNSILNPNLIYPGQVLRLP